MATARRRHRQLVRLIRAIVLLLVTTGIIWLVAHIRRSTNISATFSASEVRFQTTAPTLLSPFNYDSFVISGIEWLDIADIKSGAQERSHTLVHFHGDSSTTCSFGAVRSQAIDLQPDSKVGMETSSHSLVDLAWNVEQPRALRMIFNQAIQGSLTSQAVASGDRTYECLRIRRTPGGPLQSIQGSLSQEGGASISFRTSAESGVHVIPAVDSVIYDTNLPITGELQFVKTDTKSGEDKTALLDPPKDDTNRVTFERVGKTVVLDSSDLLIITPREDFWLRKFSSDRGGLRLSFYGRVANVALGAGSTGLTTQLPTLLEECWNARDMIALITAIIAAIKGIDEVAKMVLVDGK